MSLTGVAQAQDVTLLSETFEGFAAPTAAFTGGANNFASSQNTVTVVSGQLNGSTTTNYLYFSSGNPTSATTKTLNVTGYATVKISFVLRYFPDNGAGGGEATNNDGNGHTFSEMNNGTAPTVRWSDDAFATSTNLVGGGAYGFNDATYTTSATAPTLTIAVGSITTPASLQIRWTSTGNTNNNQWAIDDVVILATPVPEPSTYALFGVAAAGLAAGVVVRRRRARVVWAAARAAAR